MTEINDPLKQMEELTREVHELVAKQSRSSFRRYPITYALVATFGVAAIIHGFEIFIDDISFLRNHPSLVLLIGVGLLVLSGTLYKRLKRE